MRTTSLVITASDLYHLYLRLLVVEGRPHIILTLRFNSHEIFQINQFNLQIFRNAFFNFLNKCKC